MSNSALFRLLLVVLPCLAGVSVLAVPPALAHDEEAREREIEQHEQQIRELIARAKNLKEAGRHEQAQELFAKAERMKMALHEHLARHRREREHGAERAERILKGIHHGIESLEALGKHPSTLANLKEIAAQLRYELEDREAAGKKKGKEKRGGKEREVAEQYLELMHLAHRVLDEARRGDCAEVMEHACHALELRLQGRRDPEARRVFETAPKRAVQAECLGLAAEILADQGKKKPAGWLAELSRTFAGKKGKRKQERRREVDVHPRPKSHPAKMHYDLDIMETAKPALLEAGREELAHQLELAMVWRKMWLDGERGAAMQAARRKAPTIGNTAEILGHAAHLWREFDRPEKAAWLLAVRDGLLEDGGLRKPRKRAASAKDEELEELYRKLEEIQERLEGLGKHLREAGR